MGIWKRKKRELSIYLLIIFVLILFDCVLFIRHACAQGNAKDLYKKGMKANNIESKISNFKKAIERDRTFTLAYFELGKALEAKGAFDEALLYLKRALVSNPSNLDNQLKLNIVHKIGHIQRRTGRLSEAKNSLSGAINLTSDSNIKSNIYKELGEINKELGDVDTAIECYNKARRLAPEDATDLEKLISSLQKEKQLYDFYHEGITHLQHRRYQEAIAVLEKVVLADAEFKDAQVRLDEARKNLNEIQKLDEWEQLYKKGVDYLAAQNWENAKKLFQQLLDKNPDYKDTRSLLDDAKMASSEQNEQQNIKALYDQAIKHFKNRNWTKAIIAFKNIRKIQPNYLDVNQKLKQAQIQQQNQGNEAVKSQYYTQGIDASRNQDWANAIAIFERLMKIDPLYKDVQYHLKEARNAYAQQIDNNELSQIARLYQSGIAYMKQQDWVNAIVAFEKVVMLDPEYEAVQAYLSEAKAELNKQEAPKIEHTIAPSDKQQIDWLSLALIAAFISIPILGFLFVPSIRGKLYLRRGKYEKACRIYERMFGKRPNNSKLSLTLAQIYHELKREDAKAVKVYETVLRKNLDTPIKRDISAIVAYYYLSQGNADHDKIDILEQALRKGPTKLNSTRG